MQPVILAVLVLLVVQILLPANFRYFFPGPDLTDRVKAAMGPRDTPPVDSVYAGRAARAVANLQETLPVFLTLALLHEVRGTGDANAIWAWAYFGARVVYVPIYLAGVPGLRTFVWAGSLTALVALGLALP